MKQTKITEILRETKNLDMDPKKCNILVFSYIKPVDDNHFSLPNLITYYKLV